MGQFILTTEQSGWFRKLNNLNSIAKSLESIATSLEILSGRKSIKDI